MAIEGEGDEEGEGEEEEEEDSPRRRLGEDRASLVISLVVPTEVGDYFCAMKTKRFPLGLYAPESLEARIAPATEAGQNLSRKVIVALIALSAVLIASLTLNLVVSRKARAYYLQLQATRLDPLGLKTYASSTGALQRPVMVFYGDSRAEQWPAPDRLKKATVINRGIGNQTTAQILRRFQQDVASLSPELVVLQAGVNDLKTIPLFPTQKETIIRDCKANLAQLVDGSLAAGARVIVTTIFPLGKVPIERKPFWSDDVATAIDEVNAYLKTLAGERVTVFDTGAVLTDARGLLDPKYSDDLLHLTSEGYAALNRSMDDILVPEE